MQKSYDTIIIGAGASGLMLGAQLPAKSRTLILEANPRPGAKLLISGGGKCNITHADLSPEDYRPDAAFVRPALSAFGPDELLEWLRRRGLEPVLRKENQYFCPQSARQIVTLLEDAQEGTILRQGCRVDDVRQTDDGWCVRGPCGTFCARALVVASGGISYPQVGVSDIGYRIARAVGHTVVTPRPALVGLTLQKKQAYFKELSGLSTEVRITGGEAVSRGHMLFAHKGISGPAVLDASLDWHKGTITIDFLPDFDWLKLESGKKQISTLLPLPRRLAKALLKDLGLEDKAAGRLTAEERVVLRRLSAYEMAPAGTFGYRKAEVTRGGVATDRIDPETMGSRLHSGLYFIGEVLDVTGRLGGYNLQWAFSSAVLCSRDLLRV